MVYLAANGLAASGFGAESCTKAASDRCKLYKSCKYHLHKLDMYRKKILVVWKSIYCALPYCLSDNNYIQKNCMQ